MNLNTKKRKSFYFLLISVLIIIGISLFITKSYNAKKTDFEVYKVTEKIIKPYILATSVIYPNEYTELYFPLSGTVSEVKVSPEQVVRKGDVLAVLEAEEIEDQLKNAKVNLKLSQEKMAQTQLINEGQIRQLEIQLKTAGYQLNQAQQYLEKARKKYEEVESQYESSPSLALKTELEQLQETYEQAELQLKQSQANYEQIKENLENTKKRTAYDRKIASLSVEQAKLSLASAERNLNKLVLKAPYDAIILSVSIKKGDEIGNPNTQNIIENSTSVKGIVVAPLDWYPISEFYLDQIEITKVKFGQYVEAMLDSIPGLILRGRIKTKNIFPESSSGNVISYKVRAEFKKSKEIIYPGSSCTLKIFLERKKGLAIPISAVRYLNGTPYVYKVDAKGNIKAKKIEVGISDNEMIIIESGLKKGEKIVKNIGDLINSGLIKSGSQPPNEPTMRGPFGR